jgi:hypothetical protein
MPVFLGTSNIENFNLGVETGNTVYLGKQLIAGAGFQFSSDTVLLNAANTASYAGSGSVWNNLVGNNVQFLFSQSTGSQGDILFTGSNSLVLNTAGYSYPPFIYNPNTELLDLTNGDSVSIYCVVKLSDVSDTQQIFSKQQIDGGVAGYAAGINQFNPNDGGRFGFDVLTQTNQGRLIKQISGSLAANTWYHLCATWNGNTTSTDGISLYLNGVTGSNTLISPSNVSLTGSITSNVRASVGSRRPTYGVDPNQSQIVRGRIGAVYVYKNRVLTPSDVSDLYTSLSSSFTN